jgi:hypothetical protein
MQASFLLLPNGGRWACHKHSVKLSFTFTSGYGKLSVGQLSVPLTYG